MFSELLKELATCKEQKRPLAEKVRGHREDLSTNLSGVMFLKGLEAEQSNSRQLNFLKATLDIAENKKCASQFALDEAIKEEQANTKRIDELYVQMAREEREIPKVKVSCNMAHLTLLDYTKRVVALYEQDFAAIKRLSISEYPAAYYLVTAKAGGYVDRFRGKDYLALKQQQLVDVIAFEQDVDKVLSALGVGKNEVTIEPAGKNQRLTLELIDRDYHERFKHSFIRELDNATLLNNPDI